MLSHYFQYNIIPWKPDAMFGLQEAAGGESKGKGKGRAAVKRKAEETEDKKPSAKKSTKEGTCVCVLGEIFSFKIFCCCDKVWCTNKKKLSLILYTDVLAMTMYITARV